MTSTTTARTTRRRRPPPRQQDQRQRRRPPWAQGDIVKWNTGHYDPAWRYRVLACHQVGPHIQVTIQPLGQTPGGRRTFTFYDSGPMKPDNGPVLETHRKAPAR